MQSISYLPMEIERMKILSIRSDKRLSRTIRTYEFLSDSKQLINYGFFSGVRSRRFECDGCRQWQKWWRHADQCSQWNGKCTQRAQQGGDSQNLDHDDKLFNQIFLSWYCLIVECYCILIKTVRTPWNPYSNNILARNRGATATGFSPVKYWLEFEYYDSSLLCSDRLCLFVFTSSPKRYTFTVLLLLVYIIFFLLSRFLITRLISLTFISQ